MGITVNIVSAILKSVVGYEFGNGLAKDLIGISIDGISEKGINEITDFINHGRSKIDSVLSRKNMKSMNISKKHIDYVVAEIKDLFSKLSITEEVLRQSKYDSMRLKEYIWNEYIASKNRFDYIEHENEIKKCLIAVADILIELVCESENFEKDVLKHISNSVDDANVGLQKISEYMKENFDKLDDNSQILLNTLLTILEQIQNMNMQDNETKDIKDERNKFKDNRKADYVKNWNSRLFLHIDNDDNPITLADAFIMPDYEAYTNNENRRLDYKDILLDHSDTLADFIHRFIAYDKSLTLLMTGVPGSGKSSIVSWIANEYKDDDRIIILRFRDWKRIVLEETLLYAICTKLRCEEEDLEDIILVLDGFDEIKALDIRDELLNAFLNDIRDLKNFKCIITSRPTYINATYFHYVVNVKKFNLEKVDTFYKKITGSGLDRSENINSNLDVLGVPVILYMSIMAEIDISENHTEPELYSCIFAEKGGIFDKFSFRGSEYDNGNQILRDPHNIKKYVKFLKKIAFTMFEKNDIVLLKDQYEVPKLDFQGKSINVLEFPIKNLFENSNQNIEFIHKSLYEYFVAEYIFTSISKVIMGGKSKRSLARILGKLLKKNILSLEILFFLKYKVQSSELNSAFDIVNKTFQLMLRDGMTYYLNKQYKNIIKYEMNIFRNMLEIIHLWENEYYVCDASIYTYLRLGGQYLNLRYLKIDQSGEMPENKRMDLSGLNLCNGYLNGSDLSNMNLYGSDLSGAKLEGANLKNTDLREANLRDADLRGSILEFSNLRNADLTRADLCGAVLKRTSFREANLRGAKFNNANLTQAFLREANLKEAILEGADLTQTDFIDTDLKQTNLESTNLKQTIFDEEQVEYLDKSYELHNVRVLDMKNIELHNYLDYKNKDKDK